MGCLTSGLSISCSNYCAGGVNKFWIASIDDITSVTITAGEVTAITMAGLTDYFYEFTPYQETAVFNENSETVNCNTVVTSELQATFVCRSQDIREAIQELHRCCCGLVVVHQEANGNRWIWGLTPDLEATLGIGFTAKITATTSTSGTTIADANQTTLTIQARSTFQAYPLDGAVVLQVAP